MKALGANERSSGPDLRFAAQLVVALGVPLAGPVSLCLNPPDSDVGRIFAWFGWPLLYFLGGLFASYFDQPRHRDGPSDEALPRLKWRAHHLRVGWLFFLLLFEGLAALWILAEYVLALLPFVVIAYAIYALLAVCRLVCRTRIRECGERREEKGCSDWRTVRFPSPQRNPRGSGSILPKWHSKRDRTA